ncbi:MAG: hypothetical protein WBD20_27335 [Pirellulaceae bacterium]
MRDSSSTPYGNGAVYVYQQYNLGLLQGAANTVNGVQDAAIELANLALAAGVGVSYLVHGDNGIGFIESPDWSRGLFTHESGTPGGWDVTHGWGKFACATGV